MRWRCEGLDSVEVMEEDEEDEDESEDSSFELSPSAWGRLPLFSPVASDCLDPSDMFLFLTASGSSCSLLAIWNLAVSTTSHTSLRCLSCLATFL